jgi:hypothetical protein
LFGSRLGCVPGGCTSSYEALSQGTLVVSYPSDTLRGRFTFAMLTRFGLQDLLATSMDGLVKLAVAVSDVCIGVVHACPWCNPSRRCVVPCLHPPPSESDRKQTRLQPWPHQSDDDNSRRSRPWYIPEGLGT